MPRYLAFSAAQNQRQPNPLQSYQLDGTKLLPEYFGTINAVNIFLGENNSGKSRFMREIMRSGETKTIVDDGNQQAIVDTIVKLKQYMARVKSIFNISIKTRNTMRNSDFETAFGKLFFVKSSTQDNEIKLPEYWNTLKDIVFLIDESYYGIKSSIASSFQESDLHKNLNDLIVDFERIRNIFKAIAADEYRFQNRNQFFNNYHHGFIFQQIFWEQDAYGNALNLRKAAEGIMEQIGKIMEALADIQLQVKQLQSTIAAPASRTYIPTLRSARTLIAGNKARLESGNDVFLHTTQHDYGLADSGVVVDTGFGLYEAVDTTRNARHQGRTSFKAFEQFLSTTFFNGKPVEVVAERVRDERGGNILVSVAGVERDIHDLGDGIQAIIMLLYPLFIAPNRAWFFIEEPETHLHPGFQRLFIETITSNPVLRSKHLTLFLTTHSNHLLDYALDETDRINLFTFRRREGPAGRTSFQIQLSAPRDLQNLTALGVQNSSVFLANCTLWVEGITDRLYLRAYLHAYWQHLQQQGHTVSLLEGLHYTFLEYAGANVAHYDFAELAFDGHITPDILAQIRALSVANRIMLIADRDAGKQTRHDARAGQQHAGFVYHVLPVREVENLLSPPVLVNTLRGLYPKLAFDATGLKQNAYIQAYLGKYLRAHFPDLPDTFAPAKGSGTLGSATKRKFAEEAVKHVTWGVMSPAARTLTQQIHQFILAHNPRLGSN